MTLVTKQGFEPNQKELGLHVRSDIAARPSLQIAQKIANRANETAPFAKKVKGDRRRRHLKGSYKARRDGNLRVGKHSRAISVVESHLIEASTNEFGVKGQPARRPLLRAAIAVPIEEFGTFDGRSPGPEGFGGGA